MPCRAGDRVELALFYSSVLNGWHSFGIFLFYPKKNTTGTWKIVEIYALFLLAVAGTP